MGHSILPGAMRIFLRRWAINERRAPGGWRGVLDVASLSSSIPESPASSNSATCQFANQTFSFIAVCDPRHSFPGLRFVRWMGLVTPDQETAR